MTANGIIGTLGKPWRADVTAWGAVLPWDGAAPLDWHVAADDRWHSPATEAAVRQARIGGAPVFETRARIPGGDAVHRVWSVADGAGMTIVELTNDSPLPIACALTRRDLLTSRPPADVPIKGIDLPAESTMVVPIGHHSTVRVALRHERPSAGALPTDLPQALSVARGWTTLAERASRLVLPDANATEVVIAARCDLVLGGLANEDDDPVEFLLGAGELVRLGELGGEAAALLSPAVADAVAAVARRDGWAEDAALAAAGVVLASAEDRRALADLAAIVNERPPSLPPDWRADDIHGGIAAVAAVERTIASGPRLLPAGFPTGWLGGQLEAHGLVVGPTTRLSLAVRWHGPNPAVLWDVTGEPVELSAPAIAPTWRSSAVSGETLWRLGPVTSAP